MQPTGPVSCGLQDLRLLFGWNTAQSCRDGSVLILTRSCARATLPMGLHLSRPSWPLFRRHLPLQRVAINFVGFSHNHGECAHDHSQCSYTTAIQCRHGQICHAIQPPTSSNMYLEAIGSTHCCMHTVGCIQAALLPHASSLLLRTGAHLVPLTLTVERPEDSGPLRGWPRLPHISQGKP